MPSQYFYDQNVRKWMYQIIRLFSEFTVTFGLNPDGSQAYSTVPVIWGDATFSAATIARLNSENVMPSFPMISIYISHMKFDRPRTQTPTFEDVLSVRTRQWDANVGAYLPTQANAYTVKRFMPVPYDMGVKIDIVTSNTDQKCQILEQLLPLFNPALELQKVDNYLDWESLSYLEMDDVNWSNRSIPVGQGSDSSYDVCTLSMHAPIWMSLPAKVSKMGVIFKVINNINGLDSLQDIVLNTRQVVTYNNYGLYVRDGKIQVLKQGANYPNANTDIAGNYWNGILTEDEENIGMEQPNTIEGNNQGAPAYFFYGEPLEWTGLLAAYGAYKPGVSMIGLTLGDLPGEILGTITVDPVNPTYLLYTVNAATLPQDTLSSINMVVNPQEVAPGIGLSNANIGDSYLLTNAIGTEWPYDTGNANATASANDIITFNGNAWITTFSASQNIGNIQFVQDNTSGLQYQWNGNAWVLGWNGPYDNAHWRMII